MGERLGDSFPFLQRENLWESFKSKIQTYPTFCFVNWKFHSLSLHVQPTYLIPHHSSCDHTCYPILNNVKWFFIKSFLWKKTIESRKCDNLPRVNSSMTNLSLFVSSKIGISSNSSNQNALKIVLLNSWTLHNFLKHLEVIVH